MSDYQTTEEKLKSAEYANTGLLLLIIAIIVGFTTHFAIGVLVFLVGLFLNHLSEQRKEERQRALERAYKNFHEENSSHS